MSKGLGKVEKFVVVQVDGWREEYEHAQVKQIAKDLAAEDGREPTRSDFESVRRAVRSLRRKGLITAEWFIDQDTCDADRHKRPTVVLQLWPALDGEDWDRLVEECSGSPADDYVSPGWAMDGSPL